ncbi:ABC-F family ATP-binding cassette domain-containing protein [Aeromonas rivipollensis]|uniref:ABC-F family ATP-binding cassette domain-containing protein n=1 Tax=Aeromonas rivipollensis TaxID=948519 RepID=UPI00259F8D9A|nr:ABC-F family ATP-binding cassette domain-containing protein [Aeromonas rivipollensis]MDM5124229.1 ATP-binding cassette domain-containing protein [Aeromonas rivipollensis]
MTTLMSTHSLQMTAGHLPLFDNIDLGIQSGDRLGLIGANGCGKSTLLALLAGKLQPHDGRVQQAAPCRCEFVAQHLPPRLQGLGTRAVLQDALAGDPAADWQVDKMLTELQLEEQAELPVSALSGGQHTRLQLGRALLRQPNLLLLDEPSNHLDLPALLWLEQFLLGWRGALVLVSHDARLLDRVTSETLILRDGRLHRFALPCSQARVALAEEDEQARLRRADEQKEIDRLSASSKRLATWGREHDNEKLVRQAKSMEKRITRLQEEQSQVAAPAPWRLELHGQALPADALLRLEALEVRPAPGLPPLLRAEDLWLRAGDRVALLGANGTGKSSLLRQCWRELRDQGPDEGWYRHPGASIAYYDQSLQQLDGDATLSDALYPLAPLPEVTLRQALIRAGFPYSRHGQRVHALSGGERARLLFLALSLASHHLLWLDEPTNHLDLAGKEELAEALNAFPGGVLLVSHDRDLIERSCNRFWLIRDGRIQEAHSAERAYAELIDHQQRVVAEGPSGHDARQAPASTVDDEEALLARWYELDALLAADLARKPRHQTPRLRQEWRHELARLAGLLGLVES